MFDYLRLRGPDDDVVVVDDDDDDQPPTLTRQEISDAQHVWETAMPNGYSHTYFTVIQQLN